MAGQATKNRQTDSDSSWTIPEKDDGQPPKPLAVADDSWLAAPIGGADTQASSLNQAAVQLVQHTEPVIEDSPQALTVEMPTLQIPDGELPTFREPGEAVAVTAAAAENTLQLPGSTDADPSESEQAENEQAESGQVISMSLPGFDPPAAPTTPAITLGQPSVVNTETGQAESPTNQPTNDGQPNILRSGDGNGLRGGIELTAEAPLAPEPAPHSGQPATDEASPMLRAITLPQQPSESQAIEQQRPYDGGLEQPQDAATQRGYNAQSERHSDLMAPQESSPQMKQPGVRIVNPNDSMPLRNDPTQFGGQPLNEQQFVGQPYGEQQFGGQETGEQPYNGQTYNAQPYNAQPFGGQETGGPGRGGVQAGGPYADPTYNQPAANYGPPHGSAPAAQPLAPPLRRGPNARIASLPEQNTIRSPGYQPNTFEQPRSAAELNVDPSATMDSPGDRRFDGVQSPSIVIHKRAPAEVKVGKPAQFVIHVQNVGPVEALDVRVTDRVPAGMQLVDASPSPLQQGNLLIWQLGSMKAGDERAVTLRLVPMEEGELGSVARVTFEAAASVRTMSTRPELKIVQRANEKVLIGQQLEIDLEFSNPGTGAATGVIIQEDVPEGLEHPKGRQLDNVIGTLQPGETRRQVLRLRAVAPGTVQNTIFLKGDDGLEASHTIAVEIVSPQLQMALQGPSRRFLERQATYELDIANSGTADATNVEIAAYLDRGFNFVSTDFEGQYDPSRHAVFWSLANLPPGEQGKVPLTLLPIREGERAIRLEARADLGVVAKNERTVSVDSLAELTFQITDSADPIEIGGETMYEIRLTNSGSRNDSNVQVQLQLPQGVELVSSDADAETDGRGLVAFAPRQELAAGSDIVYRVKARGVAPGTHLIKAVVVSDQSTVPVTKEESTMVYADR